MFEAIKNIIKRVIATLSKSDVTNKLKVDISASDEMLKHIKIWSDMYYGNPPWLGDTVKSLNLPSMIASEVARTVTLEMKSEIAGSPRADYLNETYQEVVADVRRYVEYGCAKGGIIFKPYLDGDKLAVNYIQADCFYPTAFDSSGRITGAVFVDQIKRGNKVYTRLEIHNLADGSYTVTNKAYQSDRESDIGREIDLVSVPEWQDLNPEIEIRNIAQPLFAYFKVPHANTIDTRSPLGVSVYSRAVDLIQEADKQYSRLLWEFESGERALYVDSTAFRKVDGKSVLPDKRLYRTLDLLETNKLFDGWSPAFREQSILSGLNSILIKIEDTCGLSRGAISNPDSEARTATELKILRQRSYATVTDTQKALQAALTDLVYAMDVWSTLYNLSPSGKYEISFDFDDSIVTDREQEFVEKQMLVTMGTMQQWEFRMWYFGETEEQAKQAVGGTLSFGGDG